MTQVGRTIRARFLGSITPVGVGIPPPTSTSRRRRPAAAEVVADVPATADVRAARLTGGHPATQAAAESRTTDQGERAADARTGRFPGRAERLARDDPGPATTPPHPTTAEAVGHDGGEAFVTPSADVTSRFTVIAGDGHREVGGGWGHPWCPARRWGAPVGPQHRLGRGRVPRAAMGRTRIGRRRPGPGGGRAGRRAQGNPVTGRCGRTGESIP